MQVEARGAGRVSFVGSPGRGQSVVKALAVFALLRVVVAALSVFLVNGRGGAFLTAVVAAVKLLKVPVVLACPRVSAPAAWRVLSVPFLPPLFLSAQDASPLPLTRLIPLPLEGPPHALPPPLAPPLTAEAHHSVVQLEGAGAAPSSDVLLGVTEVEVRPHLWWTET